MATENVVAVVAQPPASAPARAMLDALWDEIQQRYEFTAPNVMGPERFSDPPGGFWVAFAGDRPVGSIGLMPFSEGIAELDGMYVAPDFRGLGVAQLLMSTVETHARELGLAAIRLRAGGPQPEAVRFYQKVGFQRIPSFGNWVEDDTAWCFEKAL
jgi:putative acetyltransferase